MALSPLQSVFTDGSICFPQQPSQGGSCSLFTVDGRARPWDFQLRPFQVIVRSPASALRPLSALHANLAISRDVGRFLLLPLFFCDGVLGVGIYSSQGSWAGKQTLSTVPWLQERGRADPGDNVVSRGAPVKPEDRSSFACAVPATLKR